MLFKRPLLIILAVVVVSTIALKRACFKPKQRRVYVDMVADMFHPGHVAFLKQARAFGDYLIVGLNNDEDVKSYKRLPIMNLEERTQAVSACKYVDEVIPNCPLRVTDEFIDQHKIDVVVHGDDFNPETIQHYYGVPIRRNMFKTVPYTKGVSTSDLIRRIRARAEGEI
jgi:cytidyltransferase-like protein